MVSNTINWLPILLPFAVMILFFGSIILFAQKWLRNRFLRFQYGNNALEINIIKANHFVITGIVNMMQGEFIHNGMTYLIDEKAIYYEKWKIRQKPMAWYYENNPNPIMFDFKTKEAKFTGVDLTKWTQSKLVQMLLDTNIEKFLMIILILCIVIALITALAGGGNYMQGAKIIEMINQINQSIYTNPAFRRI
jgi:hypothetical protein